MLHSVSINLVGITADAVDSWGKIENTNIFRKNDGTFSPNKYFLYQGGILGGTLIADKFIGDKHPRFKYITFGLRVVLGIKLLKAGLD